MRVRLGLNVVGLLTAEITTASTLKTMSTRKAKLHMGAQAIIYLCVATMNQFTRLVTWLRVRLPSPNFSPTRFRLASATPDES